MVVIILHPTEELIFAKLQKELTAELFEDGRIMYSVKPLWIQVNTVFESVETTAEHELSKVRGGFDTAAGLLNHRNFSKVELGKFEITETEVFIPVTIIFDDGKFTSKLTLVNLYNGSHFTDSDHKIISKIKQPVRQLKIFRLGVEKELSSNSKCITDSKWIKIKSHYIASSI